MPQKNQNHKKKKKKNHKSKQHKKRQKKANHSSNGKSKHVPSNRIKHVKELRSLSILRSPLRSTDSDSTHTVSFGDVEVHEFPLLAGSESDGVPEDGALSLHLALKEINNEILNVDEYEKMRYERWKQRAIKLHWNNKRLSEKYLFTAGRCDDFYGYLTHKERERRIEYTIHKKELKEETIELNRIRKSRRNNGIFCLCKPLSLMSLSELKVIAKQYDICVNQHRKVKKGFLINQLKAKVLNYRDVCCWDRSICSCCAAEIDCHSGSKERNFQCGCIKYHKKCINKNGRYVYKEPHYNKSLINEWNEYYQTKTVA